MNNKAYCFQIYPTKEQRVLFAKTFGCVRFLYNQMLGDKIAYYEEYKKNLQTKPAQYKREYPWLKEVDSLALCNAQLHLETAYKNFFRDPKVGYPKFKAKHRSKKSYTTNMVNHNIKFENNTGFIVLPKVGKIKLNQHRKVPEEYKLKSVTVSQTSSGEYYVSILFAYESQVPQLELQNFLGLDFSMRELYRDSNGEEPAYPRYYRMAEAKLKKEQRRLSKMEKGSNNRGKQRRKVARLHGKVANQRKDFLHKESRKIVNGYDCVCIEDLDMKAMAKSLNFGKSVLDNGWGMFTRMLAYKLEEKGERLIKVDKFFASSQICHCCGYKNVETKNLAIREWSCPQCGAKHDRDINAAINIKNEGMRIAFS